jgi:hypothetical protein
MMSRLGAGLCAVLLGSFASALEPLPRDPTLSPLDIFRLSQPLIVTPPPPPPPRPREPRLEIEGIVEITEGDRFAIIEGEVYRKGAALHGARILDIGRLCVSFRYKKRLLRRCIPR